MNLQRKKCLSKLLLRDELERLSNYYYDSINSESLKNTDVIGVVSNKEVLEISILFFRGGYIIDKAEIFTTIKLHDTEYEAYQILKQFYSSKSSVPKRIIIKKDFKYTDDLKYDLKNLGFFETKFESISKGRKT